jgi:DNA-binding response OmpR family regulator
VTAIDPASLFATGETSLPRFRHVGDLTLDLFHHDGRVDDQWLSLEPHEFALLWRWAREPGGCFPQRSLMRWASHHASVQQENQHLLAKLCAFRLEGILACRDACCRCLSGSAAS